MNNKLKNKKGFTLLFSLLILTIILSASLGIYNIVVRQFKISQISRESSRAFTASDAGIECALYWDIKKKEFDKPNYDINCFGSPISGSMVASTTTFYLGFSNGSCAQIDVDKDAPPNTKLISYGYNIGNAGSNCAVTSGKLQVERVLQASY